MTKILAITRRDLIVTSITAILITCAILLNIFAKDPLFIMGVQFSATFQRQFKKLTIINIIENLISLLCNPIFGVLVILVYFFLTKRKLTAMVYTGFAITTIFIIAVMKQWFQQSRPFWYNREVQILEWTCPKDFGNPSGHSVATFLIYYPLIADIAGLGTYKQGWAFLIFIGVAVPLSRVYLGAHSVNQVVFGLFLGISSVVLYKFVFQKFLYRLYWNLLTLPLRIPILVGIIFLNVACFAFQILIYGYNTLKYPLNSVDLENLNHGCNLFNDSLYYQRKALQSCALIQILFGFLYGLMALQSDDKYFLLGMHSYSTNLKAVLYYVLCLFAGILPILLSFLLQQLLPIDGVEKYAITSIGLLVTGFVACWVWTRLLHYLQISSLPGRPIPQKISRRYHEK